MLGTLRKSSVRSAHQPRLGLATTWEGIQTVESIAGWSLFLLHCFLRRPSSHKGKQAFFLDGKLVVSYEERSPINATEGYFGFSVFESTVMLGAISIGRLP